GRAFFVHAEDGIRGFHVTGVQTCALPISWVAPHALASSSFCRFMSTARISAAPAMRAPWMAEMPTPPAPYTITEEPGTILAVLKSGRASCTERRYATAYAGVAMPNSSAAN